MTAETSILSVQSRAYQLTTAFIDSLRASRKCIDPNDAQQRHNRGPFLRAIEEIDSVSALAEYLAFMPSLPDIDFNSAEEMVRKLSSGETVHSYFVGSGLSFSVHATTRNPLPVELLNRLPKYLKDQFSEKGHRLVAIKRAHVEVTEGTIDPESEAKAIRAIAWEYHVLNHIPIQESENVIKLLGVTWEPVHIGRSNSILLPILAMEFANQGSLDDLLDSNAYRLHFSIKRKLCLDVARGLAALHDSRICHGDVKTNNVLLCSRQDGSLVAKIADFGCSMHTSGQDGLVFIQGHTPPWDAPEVYIGDVYPSDLHKLDIYCWGLLVWRVMLDGRTPFDFHRTSSTSPVRNFGGLGDCNDLDKRLRRIQELKLDPKDSFLAEVIPTLADNGLDECLVMQILQSTLRCRSSQRIGNFHDLVQMLGGQQASVSTALEYVL
jgi:serine/threonine protein kinase